MATTIGLSSAIDRQGLAAEFAEHGRAQVRDVLAHESAVQIATLLAQGTPWGISWQADEDGPHKLRREELARLSPQAMPAVSRKLNDAMGAGAFAFVHAQYQISNAVREGWSESPAHDALLHELNSEPVLTLVRQISGFQQIRWCDAQATHFGPAHFLSLHQDINTEPGEDRLVAYVLSLCLGTWSPDWGGYLNFFNDEGDIVHGYMPRFNCLNLFRVPQHHNVSFVAPFAQGHRLAIAGWFRGR